MNKYITYGPSSLIQVPPGTTVTLTTDSPLPTGKEFDVWTGNFTEVGVSDIIVSTSTTHFTMVRNNVNAEVRLKDVTMYRVTTTNATGGGSYPENTERISIIANKPNTEDIHYVFTHWTCVDDDNNDCISFIDDPDYYDTVITRLTKNLSVEAHFTAYYKLTVVNGQNTDVNPPFYYEGQTVTSVYANSAPSGQIFNKWSDPAGVIPSNEYVETPTIVMRDSPATITAQFVSTDVALNSIAVTGNELHTGIITRNNSQLISGIFTIGTIVFDRDGCIGVITQANPDQSSSTDDYRVQKLFYGGNS